MKSRSVPKHQIRSVNPDIIIQDVLCCFNSFFLLQQRDVELFCRCLFNFLSVSVLSFFLSRWRGPLHNSSYQDDDGRLVDVCSYCHLLVYCQSSSFPHHHTHRELHTVSTRLIFPSVISANHAAIH